MTRCAGNGHPWFMPVILVTWGTEMGRAGSRPTQAISSQKPPSQTGAGHGAAQPAIPNCVGNWD
jgi:hypothetical protein